MTPCFHHRNRHALLAALLVVAGTVGWTRPTGGASTDSADWDPSDFHEALRRSPALTEGMHLLRLEREAAITGLDRDARAAREHRARTSDRGERGDRPGRGAGGADSVRFLDSRDYEVGEDPFSLVTGRFNRDRRLDVATANYTGRSVSILVQARDGELTERHDIPVDGSPYDLAANDLDGDGDDDLAVALVNEASVLVLLADGSGGFVEEGRYAVGRKPTGVILADLDADGRLDIACTNAADSTLTLLRRTSAKRDAGRPLFIPWRTHRVGARPQELLAGDFNGDGALDLVVACVGRWSVLYLAGRGAGEFAAEVVMGLDRPPRNLAATDFDSDGDLDLVVAVPVGFVPLVNDAHGNFTPRARIPTKWDERVWAAVADMDDDGDDDVLLSCAGYSRSRNGFVGVSLNDRGTFRDVLYYLARNGTLRVATADVNADGKPDALAVNEPRREVVGEASTVSVLLGRGDGQLAGISRQILPPGSGYGTRASRLHVLERRGHPRSQPPDLLMTRRLGDDAGEARVMRNLGDGRFSEPVPAIPYQVRSVCDVDGDGVSDVICRRPGGSCVVFAGDRDGGFTEVGDVDSCISTPCSRGCARRSDIGPTSTSDGPFVPPLAAGAGGHRTWGAADDVPLGPGDVSCMRADLDGDRFEDLLVVHRERREGDPTRYLWDYSLRVFENPRGEGYRLVAVLDFVKENSWLAGSMSFSKLHVQRNRRDRTVDIVAFSECGDCSYSAANIFHRDDRGGYARTDYLAGMGGEWTYMAFTDLTGDGLADIVSGRDDIQDSGPLHVYCNVGAGKFPRQTDVQLGAEISSMVAADIDVDGHSEIVILSSQRGSFTVLRSAVGERCGRSANSSADDRGKPGIERRATPMLVLGGGTDPSRLWWSMERPGPASFTLYDISGRRVIARDLGWLAAGEHAIDVPELATLRSGIYWARLGEKGRGDVRKVVLMSSGGGR